MHLISGPVSPTQVHSEPFKGRSHSVTVTALPTAQDGRCKLHPLLKYLSIRVSANDTALNKTDKLLVPKTYSLAKKACH